MLITLNIKQYIDERRTARGQPFTGVFLTNVSDSANFNYVKRDTCIEMYRDTCREMYDPKRNIEISYNCPWSSQTFLVCVRQQIFNHWT